mgnify:CR=1 FL=1
MLAHLDRAVRLSARVSDRERLVIRTGWARATFSPALRAIADTLSRRYPEELDGHVQAGAAAILAGDFLGAAVPLERAIRAGRDILLDIDVQGARAIKRSYPDAVAVFVLPPSLTELKRRLAARGTDDRKIIQRRLANARGEMRQIIYYDYYVVNRQIDEAVATLAGIVKAERARVSRVTRWRIEPLRR